MKKCTGTDYDMTHCQEEKIGCEGCHYYKEEEEIINEAKTSECAEDKGDKTN